MVILISDSGICGKTNVTKHNMYVCVYVHTHIRTCTQTERDSERKTFIQRVDVDISGSIILDLIFTKREDLTEFLVLTRILVKDQPWILERQILIIEDNNNNNKF